MIHPKSIDAVNFAVDWMLLWWTIYKPSGVHEKMLKIKTGIFEYSHLFTPWNFFLSKEKCIDLCSWWWYATWKKNSSACFALPYLQISQKLRIITDETLQKTLVFKFNWFWLGHHLSLNAKWAGATMSDFNLSQLWISALIKENNFCYRLS